MSQPLFIIASHAWYDDTLGGAFRVASEFAEGLAARGERVAFVCGARDVQSTIPRVERGVTVWRYAYPRAKSPSPANLWGHIARTYRLVKRIARDETDVIVNGHSPLQSFGAMRALGCRARFAYTVHSPVVDELLANWQGRRLSASRRIALTIVDQIERANLRRANVAHCLSQFIRSKVIDRYGESVARKTVVIPGWVKCDDFRPAKSRQELRRSLGQPWNRDAPTFFTLRRLERRMGIEQLIEASRLLADAGRSFQLLVGGSGSLQTELEAMASRLGLVEQVRFLGRVPNDVVAATFGAADCFVLPTQELEGFGLIILEAHASGTPVIGTPVGAIPEVIGAGREQWIANDASPQAIAEKMTAFLTGAIAEDPSTLLSSVRSLDWTLGVAHLEQALLGFSQSAAASHL